MSFTEYLDWLVENSNLFPKEIEDCEEVHEKNFEEFKF